MLCLTLLMGYPTLAQYTSDDWEDRDQWMRVSTLMEFAEVGEGDQVADVGCHEGYLTFHLSKKVGVLGKVFAVDVVSSRLDHVKALAKEKRIGNIKVVLGDYDNPNLPVGQLDAVFVVDTYHEIEDYLEVLSHIKTALKPRGRLLILEKLKDFAKGKSRESQAASHTLSSEYVKKELERSGFEVVKQDLDFGTWNHEPGKQMWALVAIALDNGK